MISTGDMFRLAKLAGAVGVLTTLLACQAVPPGSSDANSGAAPYQIQPASGASKALKRYYAHLQNDLLTRGLLRVDGGGPDTQFSARKLAQDFETIVFFDEYARGAGLQKASGEASSLRRWAQPVRVNLEFGDTVSHAQRLTDSTEVHAYVSRMARLTGHSIAMAPWDPNFHVMIVGEDDRHLAVSRAKHAVPNISDTALQLVRDLPREIHCMVIAFPTKAKIDEYSVALAIIRAEHSELMRRSCIHEEIAQGLGLVNDSPNARPSIFNDDDEFALLTTHDEMLLQMLYDPRLSNGMSAATARPIVRQMASELTGKSY